MKTHHALSALLLIATVTLGGCANMNSSSTASSQQNFNTYGAIESIKPLRPSNSGAGAVVGGVLGAVLGNQVGGGSGKTAATVAGAVGGAVVGNNVEQNRNAQATDRYEITVRLDNGQRSTLVQDSIENLRAGDRVRLVDGRAYRY